MEEKERPSQIAQSPILRSLTTALGSLLSVALSSGEYCNYIRSEEILTMRGQIRRVNTIMRTKYNCSFVCFYRKTLT